MCIRDSDHTDRNMFHHLFPLPLVQAAPGRCGAIGQRGAGTERRRPQLFAQRQRAGHDQPAQPVAHLFVDRPGIAVIDRDRSATPTFCSVSTVLTVLVQLSYHVSAHLSRVKMHFDAKSSRARVRVREWRMSNIYAGVQKSR